MSQSMMKNLRWNGEFQYLQQPKNSNPFPEALVKWENVL